MMTVEQILEERGLEGWSEHKEACDAALVTQMSPEFNSVML